MDNKHFTVILIGSSAVGKTSLAKCFVNETFNESRNELVTIGADFLSRSLSINNIAIRVRITDTAGQERYKAITRRFYREADAVIFVYDVTDKRSFADLVHWVNEVRQYGCKIKCNVLAGNKCDLEDQRQVPRVDGEIFAENHNMLFEEVSASKNSKRQVDQLFEYIAKELLSQATVPKIIEDFDMSLNLILIGKSSVGKSCLAKTYETGEIKMTDPTKFMNRSEKTIDVAGGLVTIKIFDFPGPGLQANESQYFFNLVNTIIVFVYDVTDKTSLGGLGPYVKIFKELGSNVLLKVLIGNKTDKMIERMVPRQIGKAAAEKHDMMYLELSARDSLMTAKGFNEIARTVWNDEKQRILSEQPEEPMVEETLPEVETVQLHETAAKKWTWCWSK